MIDNFYVIKPLAEWLKPESGLICQNRHAFAVFTMTPSAFGHSLVIPKRVIYRATDLTPEELWYLHKAKETGIDQSELIISENIEHVLELYRRWSADVELNRKIPAKKKTDQVLGDLEEGLFKGDGNTFENIGEKAGQMVRQYHLQFVPRFKEGLLGGSEAFAEYLHK